MLAIHRDNKAKLDLIDKPETLKELVACQGSFWPDSDILEFNGYTVFRIPKFESMYRMLKLKRCDYFPRSVSEGYGEIEALGSENIIAYDQILLVYPFNMKFYTSKNNVRLIERFNKGLSIMISTGRMDTLLKSHVSTKSMFPVSKYENARIFALDDPESAFSTLKNRKYNLNILP